MSFTKNIHTSSPNIVRHTSLDDTEHGHSFLTCSTSFSQRAQKPCGDLRPHLSCVLAEPRPFTRYEPKREPGSQAFHRIRVKPLSFHQPITASTYDSAESIATPPPESDSDDQQLRALLAHRNEKQVQNDRKFINRNEIIDDVQSSSRSDKYRETCHVAFKPK